jgi:methionyl-tRNA formyltransferase
VPAAWLARVQVAAINFHPGPPEYPGIGCTNFALYEGATHYGVTCHHMAANVDAGAIIRVARFPIAPTDSVWSLTQRSYAYLAVVFYEIIDLIVAGAPLPRSPERWTRRPFRRSELNALCRLTAQMSEEEVKRRLRATTFPNYPSASREPQALAALEGR